ncbi:MULTISPECIES: hypothetical protein [Paenibacillus]|uniref:Uncharacterized protein n=1 Tax=Paenibacillus azoreducens TaxID=116718 RepID=A0A919Y773_9BACL|nr:MULTISPECIES: hypothetical protein [Paenibacillus]MBE9914797.1 hypothetical protein [Paenibacillus donghaensis]GIO46221.1 hypothetical protein J34TS1_09860 [Paenibacillus azoreducens]
MKKMIGLLVMLLVLLPYQSAFAATATTSTASVEKEYFKDYKDKVKEVRNAQKALTAALCTNLTELNNKVKASNDKYNSLVKSKASKELIAQAKAQKTADRKVLSEAKKVCSKKVNEIKKASNLELKQLDKYKRELANVIKLHLKGKDQMSADEFNRRVTEGQSYISATFDKIITNLKSAR